MLIKVGDVVQVDACSGVRPMTLVGKLCDLYPEDGIFEGMEDWLAGDEEHTFPVCYDPSRGVWTT